MGFGSAVHDMFEKTFKISFPVSLLRNNFLIKSVNEGVLRNFLEASLISHKKSGKQLTEFSPDVMY